MATLAQPISRKVFAEQFYCPHHGEPGTTHTEPVFSLPINGVYGCYEPGEEWEVTICDDCGEEVKPVHEIDWSQVMEIPY